MREDHRPIPGFSRYMLSNFGYVVNLHRDVVVKSMMNQQGISIVGMIDDQGRHTTRSVSLMVAEAFIPDHRVQFNSPINLNGNRMDSHVSNLMWRPRWYAVKYHQQFYLGEFQYRRADIIELTSREEFDDLSQPAMRYGLYYGDIMLSFLNNTHVPLTGHVFRYR